MFYAITEVTMRLRTVLCYLTLVLLACPKFCSVVTIFNFLESAADHALSRVLTSHEQIHNVE